MLLVVATLTVLLPFEEVQNKSGYLQQAIHLQLNHCNSSPIKANCNQILTTAIHRNTRRVQRTISITTAAVTVVPITMLVSCMPQQGWTKNNHNNNQHL